MTNKHYFAQEDVTAYFKESEAIQNQQIEDLQNLALDDSARAKLKDLWFIKNPYEKKAGVLTFAERKVNLESIENSFRSFEEKFIAEATEITKAEKDKLLAEIRKALNAKDYAKLQELQVKFKGTLAKKYAIVMKELFEIGKKTAADEMTVKVPATSKDVSGLYRAQALQMEEKVATEMAVVAKDEALYNVSKGLAVAATLDQVEKALDLKLTKIINASGTQAIGGAFNTGRVAVYETYPDKIYGFQYTAVLDRRTTNLCQSLNGRVIAKGDPDFYRLQPPNHPKCRSFWVEILNTEFIKPKISTIPASIPRSTGYTTFQDLKKIQPYNPTANATLEELKDRREGVLVNTVTQLKAAWLDLKD